MDVLREVAKQNDISMSELMEVLIEDFQDKKKVDQAKYLRNKRKDQTWDTRCLTYYETF